MSPSARTLTAALVALLCLSHIAAADPLPAGPPGVALAPLEAAAEQRFPWLSRVPERARLVRAFALQVAWQQAVVDRERERDALPDPKLAVRSSEVDRRRRALLEARRRVARAWAARDGLPLELPVDVSRLLAADFVSGDPADPADQVDQAGRAALRAALLGRANVVQLEWRYGQLLAWLVIEGEKLDPGAGYLSAEQFINVLSYRYKALRAAHDQARDAALQRHSEDYIARHPHALGWQWRNRVADQRAADIDRLLDALPELAAPIASVDADIQAQIDAIRAERRRVAHDSQRVLAGAVAPVVAVLSVLAVQEASDVVLAVFPAGKVADAIRKLARARSARKATRAGRRATKSATLELTEELANDVAIQLSGHELRMVRALEHLSPGDARALQTIHKHIPDPELLSSLAARAAHGTADLPWLASMVERKALDGDTVRRFTRFDAFPSWAKLRAVLDNNILPRARSSFMSKLSGFLGEEAAFRHIHTQNFLRRYTGGQSLEVVTGHRTLDIMARTAKNEHIVFAEVKHWSAKTWGSTSQRNKLFRQLQRHDTEIRELLHDKKQDGQVWRLLMVTENGYKGLGDRENEFKKLLEKAGWTLELIPGALVESNGAFIDRLRKEK